MLKAKGNNALPSQNTNEVRRLIERLIADPKKLFLTDSAGAFLTGTLLVAVVVPFNKAFGMPVSTLYCLSAIAYVFSIYSFCCSYIKTDRWPLLLKALSIANGVYCILTLILLIYFRNTLTLLGFAYFTGEIVIITSVTAIEICTIKKAGAAYIHRARS
jgi:hypothetical protein